MSEKADEYKFEIGDRVHLNETAYASLPPEQRKLLPTTFKTTLFTIARRDNEGGNQYFMPGYDWQCGHGWINEEWISKWMGSGPLRLTVTIDPQGDTDEEIDAKVANVLNKLNSEFDDLDVTVDRVS